MCTMGSHFLVQYLMIFLISYSDLTYSKIYYITPSSHQHCPLNSSCLTLSQFATKSSFNETDITLLFLPGNHTLNQEVFLDHIVNFSMTMDGLDNETAFVECSSRVGRLRISETTFASITHLHFIGCGYNGVSRVNWLTITGSTFQGVTSNTTVLILNQISAATIINSSFLYNTIEYKTIKYWSYFVDRILDYVPYQQGSPCGILCTVLSNVSIISSKFMHNSAHNEIGGALVTHNSTLQLSRSTCSNNTASYGGVMVTFGSTIDIDNTTLKNNAADYGGVLITFNDTFTITRTNFANNSARVFGGVMVTLGNSSFKIINSTFDKNNGDFGGGVMYILYYDSTFNISNSTFTHNNARSGGGVMYIASDSSFHISNCNFNYNTAYGGGVMLTIHKSSITIINSTFTNNSATQDGGVMVTYAHSSFTIRGCTFTNNSAQFGNDGGVMATYDFSSFTISHSTFVKNSAFSSRSCEFTLNIEDVGDHGGVISTYGYSSFNIYSSVFMHNRAQIGGVMATSDYSSFIVINSTFTDNSALCDGGVIYTLDNSTLTIIVSTFTHNIGRVGGVMSIWNYSSFTIHYSTFVHNIANLTCGVVSAYSFTSINIRGCNFTKNFAPKVGVIYAYDSNVIISDCTFTKNNATYAGVLDVRFDSAVTVRDSSFIYNYASDGSVVSTVGSSLSIFNCIFINNEAIVSGGVILCRTGDLNIANSKFSFNKVFTIGGGLIFLTTGGSTHITNSTFDHNIGSVYAFLSNLTFSGYSKFEKCLEPQISNLSVISSIQEGGAITSFQSTVNFIDDSIVQFSNNRASHGGAILAIQSTITTAICSDITIANNDNNNITNSIGGGISLQQSRLEIKGNCRIVSNSAVKGGGIHASSSSIAVHQPATLHFINNSAEVGGGIYLEKDPKLYILRIYQYVHCVTTDHQVYMYFLGNHANYGGAVYVADDTNSDACSPYNECFIQTLALYHLRYDYVNLGDPAVFLRTVTTLFSENTASEQGSNIFGGLLDRCVPSTFAEVFKKHFNYYSGITYLGNITNIDTSLDSISSQPVRVCFCNSKHDPDCSYKPPTIRVEKGKTFNVSLVAVDQVNHTMEANISSSLSSSDGGFDEGQQTQSVEGICTNLTFNVFSPHDFETINLYPNGPCGSATYSTSQVTVQFINCTCPVGFEPVSNIQSSTRCECDCDSALSPYITDCNVTTSSVLRKGTNSWITYVNYTDIMLSGYVIFQNCPFDYCQPLTENITIDFNLPNGADSQCAYNRTGVLCGACNDDLSLSLASSRCVTCRTNWSAVFVVILIAAAVAGILLVTALLALNMTVSVGLINGFIFYANIVSAGSAIFFPSSKPSFSSVFVAWLNLDIGIDICFIDGLDNYTKTWLQLAFPVYIISLVIMVIIVSEYSPKFAGLIGKRDPISTLATLILLSYAKLLSITITALSSALLQYPNGKQETVWLPDDNVKYFSGKHIPLVLVALLIILIGLPYTILLFLWQWIVRAPRWMVFRWIRNTKLNAFITMYHAPHNTKYRYWTGLLLLVRVVLYITASVTVSANPQTFPLLTIILVGALILLSKIFGLRVYKNSLVDVVDTVLYFNLLALSAFSLYDFKANITKQTAVAYISTIISFILFIVVMCYHVTLLIKKEKLPLEDILEYQLVPVQPANAEVTHSVVERPTPDEDPPSSDNAYDNDKQEFIHVHAITI